MTKILITNANLVNEGQIQQQDMLIEQGRITQIASSITADSNTQVIDAQGKHLLPGFIDDQVHFREPGFPGKGTIASESAAAVAGGTTSFMDMPNVKPLTINQAEIENKHAIAAKGAVANYGFYLGATNDNLEAIKQCDKSKICGVKVFMGSSTGNMLVDNPDTLEQIFSSTSVPIATHCEDSPTIEANEQAAKQRWGDAVPMAEHANIRSAEACYLSSSLAAGLAKKHGSQLHVLHLTTEKELELFTKGNVMDKNITAEVCVHHLYFHADDYAKYGSQIKCNPAVKYQTDRDALRQALLDDKLDIIATDHAPHEWLQKQQPYFSAPSGVPLVQHSLLALLEMHQQGIFSLETIVQKTSHAVAQRFAIQDRGFLREGYFADVVLVDLNTPTQVSKESLRYQCGWSPFEGHTFPARIDTTLVNGTIKYQNGQIVDHTPAMPLAFTR